MSKSMQLFGIWNENVINEHAGTNTYSLEMLKKYLFCYTVVGKQVYLTLFDWLFITKNLTQFHIY